MSEKRFTITRDFEEHHRQIRDNGHIIMGCFIEPQAEVIVDLLNQLNDEKEELEYNVKRQIDFRIEYKKRVKNILQKYFDDYTTMAMELRNDKYGNSMCHDVTEVICEIADKLWIDLNDMNVFKDKNTGDNNE